MNSKRRADLQRKLSMGAVPKPPAGLAERIKADIPQYLQPVPESTSRFTAISWSSTFRIAASLITLMVTALITMRVMEPAAKQESAVHGARREQIVPAVTQYRTSASADAAGTTAPAEAQVELTIDEPLPLPSSRPAAPAPMQLAEAGNAQYDDSRRERQQAAREDEATGAVLGGFAPEPVPQMAEARQEQAPARNVVAAEAAAPSAAPATSVAASAPAPPPPAMAAPPATAPAATAQARTADTATYRKAASSGLVPEAHAAGLELDAPSSVFGISVDPAVFQSIKTAIESGRRPAAKNVDVDAVVNYFAGPPARAPRKIGLEVEASPAPTEAEGNVAILRFTVDTPRVDVPTGGSVLPVARDARVTIDINQQTVASIQRVGGCGSMKEESVLLYNTSVTGLYELQLKPRLRPSQRVATVRLEYRSVETGRPQNVEHIVHVHDLVKTWSKATRRHRLASLGALWTQTLTGTSGGPEVAKRAQELATQDPEDTRARDLAKAATATTGGGK